MPPKPAGKGKVKSAKLSKAEKEKLKKEEAERKAREEEEARLKAEQEQREKEEKERLEREERERLQEQERARHQAEVDELTEILVSNSDKLRNLQEERTAKAKWDRYMLCDGCPDPLQECELNTYMNLWKEDVKYKPVPAVLEEIEDCLKLIKELDQFLSSAKDDGISEEDHTQHKDSVKKLQMLAKHKLDESTMHLLQNATGHLDPDTQNVQYTTTSEHIQVCIWGNTAKNPRVKSFSFGDPGFTMDIPKILAVRNVAVELIYTSYDHRSPLAKSFYPKIKKKATPEVVVNETDAKEEGNPEEGEEGKDGAADEELKESLSPPKSPSTASRASRRKSGRIRSGKSSRAQKTRSARSEKSQTSDGDAGTHKPDDDKSEETKAEDSAEPPGDTSGASELLDKDEPEGVAEPLEDEDDFDEDDDDVVDLRAFSVVGPVLDVRLLELPPQPKHVGGWTIQQVVSSELKELPYQSETQGSTDAMTSEPSTPAPNTASTPQLSQQANPPISVTVKLPSHVMYFEQPQLARWEATKNQWRVDGLDEFQFDEEQKTFSFKMSVFGPLSTMQDLYLNMPFQSWELRPHAVNSCLFTVIAAIVELEIEIKDSLCCLSQPEDVDELEHLRGRWMKPKDLIVAMQKAGVNIFPAVDAEKYVSINAKDETLESRTYQEMALTASAFAYTWSKWNAECGNDKVVIQAVEQLQNEPLLEEDWSLFMIGTHSSCKLRMTEEDKELSDDIAEGTQLHSDLYHMVRDGVSQQALQRVKDSSFLFVDCVHQLLDATKVLTFS